MTAAIKLRFDLVAGIARAPARFLGRIFSEWVPALNHETLDHPVEASAVVESLLRQRLEILHRLWGGVRPKLNDHFAFRRLDYGNLFRIHSVLLFFRCGFLVRLRFSCCLIVRLASLG